MKKFLHLTFLIFISSNILAQERIAVFPFEDIDNILTHNEALLFYRNFSNEFANRNAGKFAIVPRQDVERLIGMEYHFQLSVFSASEKTSEMNSVLNGTQILSGSIGKWGNNILIIVSLYTYPELQQLPGGITLSVATKDELLSKIPELVRQMQNEITRSVTASQSNFTSSQSKSKKPSIDWEELFFNDGEKFTSLGFNLGTSFATPLLIINANFTIPLSNYTFIEGGVDFGLLPLISSDVKIDEIKYHSWYYYGRFNFFLPFGRNDNHGWYFGAGGGLMDARYKFPQEDVTVLTPVFDTATGFIFGTEGHSFFRISYALRTNFSEADNRIFIGYGLRYL